jgi:hypothetical protein
VPTPEAVETGRGSRFGMPELDSAKREGLRGTQHDASLVTGLSCTLKLRRTKDSGNHLLRQGTGGYLDFY